MGQKMTAAEKRKIAAKVMDKINKDAGEIAVGFASDVVKEITFIPTPSEEINMMLGGGIPKGRITEIFGSNSSGKTSLMLEMIGEEMETDKDSIWAWLESEESFDRDYAANVHGVDLDRLVYIDITDIGSEASLDKLESFMRSGILTGFVVNSVAGLTPKAEMEEDLAKASIALQARMMSKLMRKWTGLIGKREIAGVFINQQRTDVNSRFGDPNVTTGGRALSYYASVRFGMNKLKLMEGDPLKADEGMKISARVAKNRCVYDNPYKKCEYYVVYGEGVDKLYEIVENAPEAGVLRKSGSWFYYEEEDGNLIEAPKAIVDGVEEENVPMKFQGKNKLRDFLSANAWFAEQLKQEIRGKAARGQLIPKYQTEEEMKDIERLQKVENEIANELEKKPSPTSKKNAKEPVDKAKAPAKKPSSRRPKKEASTR